MMLFHKRFLMLEGIARNEGKSLMEIQRGNPNFVLSSFTKETIKFERIGLIYKHPNGRAWKVSLTPKGKLVYENLKFIYGVFYG